MKRSSSATNQQFYISNPVYNIKKMAMSYSRRLGRSHNDLVFNSSSRSFSSLTSRDLTKTLIGDKLPDPNESPSAMEVFDVQMNQTLKVLGKDYETNKKQSDKNELLPLFRIHHMDLNSIYTQRPPKSTENKYTGTSATVDKIPKRDFMEPDFRKVGDFEPGSLSQQLKEPQKQAIKLTKKAKPSARNVLNDLIDKMKQKSQIVIRPDIPVKTHKLVKSASAQKIPSHQIPKLFVREPPAIQKVDIVLEKDLKDGFSPNLLYVDLRNDNLGPTLRELRPSERAIQTRKAVNTVTKKVSVADSDKENGGDAQGEIDQRKKLRIRHLDKVKQPSRRSKSDNNDHLATIEEERIVD
jgi:hypothetical protein